MMKKIRVFCIFMTGFFFLFCTPFYSHGAMEGHEDHGDHADHMEQKGHVHTGTEISHFGVSPMGVMGGHTHHLGEWMLSYRYMFMGMDGNRDGTSKKSVSDVLKDFMITPTEMTMEMHMLEVMYGVTHNLTIMAMAPYLSLSMDHVTRMGREFTTSSDGIGDLMIAPLYLIPGTELHFFHINSGISLPTGSIDERDNTPAGPDQKLPYPMQLGSGTYDMLLGLTYHYHGETWIIGGQSLGKVRTGKNDNGYRLGNRAEFTAWLTRLWNKWINTSVRVDGNVWEDIHGADPELNPAMVPTADPDRRGGSRIDLLFGLNFTHKRHFIEVEGGFPFYENLDGPQLERDFVLTVGWQWTF